MNEKLIFLFKVFKIKKNLQIVTNNPVIVIDNIKLKIFLLSNNITNPIYLNIYQNKIQFFQKNIYSNNSIISKKFFTNLTKFFSFNKNIKFKHRAGILFFFNYFFINFLEFFFKTCIVFNLKKGTNKLVLKQVSFRKFSFKYFKKNLKTTKQILGVLYYSFLLKDSSIFMNFFKKIIEQLNIKLHKKLFLSLRKLIKDFYFPIFTFLGVSGVFLNVKGKIGVSGSAKKRRYYFYFGKHSITTRALKMDCKFLPIWTFTGTIGLTFLIFF